MGTLFPSVFSKYSQMGWFKMATRDDIVRELLGGTSPYQLSKKLPRASVYRIYNELMASGQLPELGTILVDSESGQGAGYPFAPVTPTPPSYQPESHTQVGVKEREAGAETVDLGPKSFPEDAVNKVRGLLGITARPKVLSMPMPELLYPAMVIAVTELGFQPMRPDDFIDTVLYQWLEACDYIPFAYIKKTELEGYAKRYGIKTTKKDVIEKQSPEGEAEDVVEEVVVKAVEESTEEATDETEKDEVGTSKKTESVVEEPHKSTVGDLLKRLRIENIRKEVENDSAGCTKPTGS